MPATAANGFAAAALCDLIQDTTLLDLHREPGEQLAGSIHARFGLDAVAVFDGDLNRVYTAGEWFADPENTLRNVSLFERSGNDPETGLGWEVLRIGQLPVGALLVRGELHSQLRGAIANLIAATFDRYHSRANLDRTENAREAERMRSAVLDSLAHAYKSPLTAILAAATGVAEIGSLSPAQHELIAIIDEQSSALNDLTMRLLTTARLDRKHLHLHLERVRLLPLLQQAVRNIRAHALGLQLHLHVEPHDLELTCDRKLVLCLLEQYLDNAAKYSDFGTAVTLTARMEDTQVLLSVHNTGPVLPESEWERIFDRYVRGSSAARSTSGTGLGLSIARSVAQAHHGDVWLTSSAALGTTFSVSFPRTHEVSRTQ